MPRFSPRLLAASLMLATALTSPALSQTAPAQTAQKPTPLADLVKAVNIPFERFTLKNGLTVIVHTDRKAPIVGVTTYYRVGSKHEPRGRTGFAHLYEHLFFGGSANVPEFDTTLEAAGSDSTNGTTSYDRTNYVETVPTGALPLALFVESDRMGHILPAVTQDKLDKQRGVVQNEKRQTHDTPPYGLVGYFENEGLFPVGHPYRHSVIGSMRDLDAASLSDVRAWFTDHYGPNNAVLVLTGDIDAATARPLIEKYFGDIPAGPAVKPVVAGPVTLPAPVHREMTDQVATTRFYRMWSGPGLNDPDAMALDAGMTVLGGLASSRLDNALVRGNQMAVQVTASADINEQVSTLEVTMDVKPGMDAKAAEKAFDDVIARFLAEGPSADELTRAATRQVSGQISALEVVGGLGGKGSTLAEGQLYSGDPAHYKAQLEAIAALTPAQVKAVTAKWLSRPALSITVTPGKRTLSGADMGGWGDEASVPAPAPDAKKPVAALPPVPARKQPDVLPVGALTFPKVETTRLSNGIEVVLARRNAVPKVLVNLSFDAGLAADSLDRPGTQGMLMAMLDEGTQADATGGQTRNATQIREEEERLGASIEAAAGMDSSNITLSALTANLAPSLGLMADIVRHPAFAPDDVARVREQRLASLGQLLNSPQGIAMHALNPLVFGPGHPYSAPGDGLGDPASLGAMTPEVLRATQMRWLRPDLARITVVGDIDMATLKAQLEASFGAWKAPATPAPVKAVDAVAPAPNPRIVLIDRAGSPQSFIAAARALPVKGRTGDAKADEANEVINLANEVLGGDFLSRLNTDLREEKSWTYGVQSVVREPIGQRSLIVITPVQADRTGDSIAAIVADMKALGTTAPITKSEVMRTTDGNLRGLPNKYETSGQMLGALLGNIKLGRAPDFDARLPDLYRRVDAAALQAAIKRYFGPEGLTFVVVGDAKLVAPQLEKLGMAVEVRKP